MPAHGGKRAGPAVEAQETDISTDAQQFANNATAVEVVNTFDVIFAVARAHKTLHILDQLLFIAFEKFVALGRCFFGFDGFEQFIGEIFTAINFVIF